MGDDLYLGVAHDMSGNRLIEVSEPLSYSAMHDAMIAAGATVFNDCSDLDNALYEADKRPNDGLNGERRFFYALRIRAHAGHSPESDAEWLLTELTKPDSVHPLTAQLGALSAMGPKHERVIGSYLDHQDPFVVYSAMRYLVRMGLADRYGDRLISLMQSPTPLSRGRPWIAGNQSYGIAARAFKATRNPRFLGALIEAAEDIDEKWTTRKNAIWSLGVAIDQSLMVDSWVPVEDPRFQSVLSNAKALYAELANPSIG